MDGTQEAILAKLSLAEGVWWLYRHALDDSRLEQIWEAGRGRCYTGQIEFSDLVRIVHNALVPYDSGREAIKKRRRPARCKPARRQCSRSCGGFRFP
jgi:hypothetical protein